MRSGLERRAAWYLTCAPTSITMRVYVSAFHARILVTRGRAPLVVPLSVEASSLIAVAAEDFSVTVGLGVDRSGESGLERTLAAESFKADPAVALSPRN